MRTLIQLLVEHLAEWPEDRPPFCTMDSEGTLFFHSRAPEYSERSGVWVPKKENGVTGAYRLYKDAQFPVVSDYATRIVTRDEYLLAAEAAKPLKALVEAIRLTLSGQEWTSETSEDIATLLREAGKDVEEYFEPEEYSVCEDCLHYLAYGESPDEYTKETQEEYFEKMEACIDRELDGREGHFSIGVVATSEDPEGRGYDEFSTISCDLCNSTLHGSRHGVSLIIQGA